MFPINTPFNDADPLLVGTHASNSQHQFATQEFLTSCGSLYTRYLIVTCLLCKYINTFYVPYQTLWYVYLIRGGLCSELMVKPQSLGTLEESIFKFPEHWLLIFSNQSQFTAL